jgi:hypothetical protein
MWVALAILENGLDVTEIGFVKTSITASIYKQHGTNMGKSVSYLK